MIADFLQGTPYFEDLANKVDLEQIGKRVFEKSADKGELIVAEGGPAAALYFVHSGAIKVFKTSPEGKEQILSIVHRGGTFNDVSAFDGGPSPAGAQAMVPSLLYGIPINDMNTIMNAYPAFAVNVCRVLAGKIRNLSELVEDLSFRNVTGRVAKILLSNSGDGGGERPRLTQQDMAAIAGTAREVVGRALKAMEEEGVIKLDRHRIVIKNKNALSHIAGACL